MTLFSRTLIIRQYLPGLYFIGVAAWLGFENQNAWMGLLLLPFIVQMLLNNRYINLILGCIMILWSAYMAFSMLAQTEKQLGFILLALSFAITNLYMARMLFLNQNFTIAALRENSLDDTLFI